MVSIKDKLNPLYYIYPPDRHTYWYDILSDLDDAVTLAVNNISSNSIFRQKHPGVLDGTDGSDGTSYPLTENKMLSVTQAMGPSWLDSCSSIQAYLGAPGSSLGKISFGTAAVAPGNHSYYWSFNDFQNLCIQFVCSSMYRCINIATNLHTVYLGWQHSVIKKNSRNTGRWRSSELRGTLPGRDRATLKMHLEAVIKRVWICNWRPRLSELKDALGGRDRPSLEMHLEAEMGWTQRYTPRPCSSDCGVELGGRDHASLEMQLETEIEWTQRCTGWPCSMW
jgi:hypothetical protein